MASDLWTEGRKVSSQMAEQLAALTGRKVPATRRDREPVYITRVRPHKVKGRKWQPGPVAPSPEHIARLKAELKKLQTMNGTRKPVAPPHKPRKPSVTYVRGNDGRIHTVVR